MYQDASLESATSNVINQQNWTTYVASKLAIGMSVLFMVEEASFIIIRIYIYIMYICVRVGFIYYL